MPSEIESTSGAAGERGRLSRIFAAVALTACGVAGASNLIVGEGSPGQRSKATVTVMNVVPGIIVVTALDNQPIDCDVFGNGCPNTGQLLRAVAVDQSTNPPTPITDTTTPSWTFGGAAPNTGAGSPSASFSYATSGNKTITLNGYGTPVTYGLWVNSASTGGGGGTGWSSPVITSFTASPSNPRIGQSVSFSCTAAGPPAPTLSIEFADGGDPVKASTATHVYGAVGAYLAKCTAANDYGTSVESREVTVTQSTQSWDPEVWVLVNGVDPCALSPFCTRTSFEATVGDTLTAYAYDRTTGALVPPVAASLEWTFANANPPTGSGQGVKFSYAQSGTFAGGVQLKFTPNNGSAASTLGVTATIGSLTLQIHGSTSNAAVGVPITFTATAGGGSGSYSSYAWDFGDQSAVGSGATTSHTYTRAGTFTIACTVRDTAGYTQTATTSLTISSSAQLWLVPGVAWISGLGGVEWQSDISIFNPSPTSPMAIQVAFLDGTRPIDSIADLTGKWRPISILPRATKAFTNVMASVFGLEKGNYGAVLVRSDGSVETQPFINGSTYDVSRGTEETVGLSLPSIALPGGASAGIQAAGDVVELVGLRDDATNHTNLAIANLYSDYLTAEVTLWGADGTRLGQPVTMQLNPFGVRQLTNVLTAAPPSNGAGYDKTANPVSAYRARIRIVSGTAMLPYASVIDDVSKDPILVTGGTAPTTSYRIPGIVRTEGKAGTLWRSDLVIYNPSRSARSVRIAYSWVDGFGFGRTSSTAVPFTPGQIIQWVDFVKLWLSLLENDTNQYLNAFVDVSPGDANADPILVTSRVYNNQPTGNVGLGIPGYTDADVASETGSRKRLILAGLRSDANFRSNVALFFASGSSVSNTDATLTVYNANGTFLVSTPFRLTVASSFVQFSVDELVAGSGVNLGVLSVVVENLAGSAIGGYATVIDNRSGDGTLISGIPSP